MAENKIEDEDLGASPAQKSSKILGLLIFINLLISGAALFKILSLPTEPVIINAAGDDDDDDDDDETEAIGPIHAFDTFLVNLNEVGGGRFLRITAEIEVTDEEALLALQTNERRAKDEILRYLSNLTVDATLGEENRLKIQQGIAARINPLLGVEEGDDPIVRRVYFPDFVVQ